MSRLCGSADVPMADFSDILRSFVVPIISADVGSGQKRSRIVFLCSTRVRASVVSHSLSNTVLTVSL
jgi:hypothetical protein